MFHDHPTSCAPLEPCAPPPHPLTPLLVPAISPSQRVRVTTLSSVLTTSFRALRPLGLSEAHTSQVTSLPKHVSSSPEPSGSDVDAQASPHPAAGQGPLSGPACLSSLYLQFPSSALPLLGGRRPLHHGRASLTLFLLAGSGWQGVDLDLQFGEVLWNMIQGDNFTVSFPTDV